MSVPVQPPQKKLTRSRTDKKIAGVCAGFGEYLDLDVALVRILWVIMAFFGGWGVIAYVVAWIIMPEEPAPQAAAAASPAAAPQAVPNP
jgi:phage shock protein C